jgi:phage shock protein PspC (stress-responsive transcriptional regulator)
MDTSTAPPDDRAAPDTARRLHRSLHGRILGGVAAGLAEWLELDASVVRIGFVVLALLGGLAVPLYVAGWLLIPDEGANRSVAEEWLGHTGAP